VSSPADNLIGQAPEYRRAILVNFGNVLEDNLRKIELVAVQYAHVRCKMELLLHEYPAANGTYQADQ
jgi:hypothetical protein